MLNRTDLELLPWDTSLFKKTYMKAGYRIADWYAEETEPYFPSYEDDSPALGQENSVTQSLPSCSKSAWMIGSWDESGRQ